jgi:hypothetical protein
MNDAERRARLAAALRENLRKRKAQGRAAVTQDRETPKVKQDED